MIIRNLLVFVADSLRYDFVPKSIAKSGTLIRTLAPSLSTPTSFASLITARSPRNHNVRTFFDSLNPCVRTVFDAFGQGSYYDHPSDPMRKIVLKRCPPPRELTEMNEPLVWVERALETHIPYNKIKHGNEIETTLLGKDYIRALKSGKIDAVREYAAGVKGAEEHFWTHIDDLKSMGLYKRTLVVLTSDHGELLGEYGRFTHNFPPCRELVEVPTVFLNAQLDAKFMRTIDILPTAFGIMGLKPLKGWDGIDVTRQAVETGINLVEGRVLTLWKWNGREVELIVYYKKVGGSLWMPLPIPVIMLDRELSRISKQTALMKMIEY